MDGGDQNVEERDAPLEKMYYFFYVVFLFSAITKMLLDATITGRIVKRIEYWCVPFQGAAVQNYALDMVHFVACIKCIWSQPLRDLRTKNC